MYLPEYTLEKARSSVASLLPALFAYIDYRLIGTYEHIREANTAAVYTSIRENGYKGPAPAVFYAGDDHELQDLKLDSLIDSPYGTIGVADGHNRLNVIRLLDEEGLLSSRYIPVQVIPAHDLNIIRVNTRDAQDTLLPISEVEQYFSTRDSVMSAITGYFETKLTDGLWVSLREAQPDVVIRKELFLR